MGVAAWWARVVTPLSEVLRELYHRVSTRACRHRRSMARGTDRFLHRDADGLSCRFSPRSLRHPLDTGVMNRILIVLLLASTSWLWPIGSAAEIVGPYAAPEHRYAAGHRGIDIAATPEAPVLAPADGTVFFAGTVVDRPIVTIRLADGTLASVEPVVGSVSEGAAVVRGQEIGRVGSGGHCSERCVHLGVRVEGDYVSPLKFLGGIERAVLLPMR